MQLLAGCTSLEKDAEEGEEGAEGSAVHVTAYRLRTYSGSRNDGLAQNLGIYRQRMDVPCRCYATTSAVAVMWRVKNVGPRRRQRHITSHLCRYSCRILSDN